MVTPAVFYAAVVAVAFVASVVDVASSVVVAAFEAIIDDDVVDVADHAAPSAIVAPAVAVDGPPLPPRIEDRSSLAKLELRVEK